MRQFNPRKTRNESEIQKHTRSSEIPYPRPKVVQDGCKASKVKQDFLGKISTAKIFEGNRPNEDILIHPENSCQTNEISHLTQRIHYHKNASL